MQKVVAFARKTNGTLMSAGTGSFQVYEAGTTTPVSIYSTDSTGAAAPSSTIPVSGKIEFYARNGRIKIVATESAETVTIDDIAVNAGVYYGTFAGRPAAGSKDRLYIATDIGRAYYDNESAWKELPDLALDAMDWSPAADVTAATTTDVFGGIGNYVEVTHASGTVAITALASSNATEGSPRLVKFTISGGTLTLTHNATSLEINDGESLTLVTGDMALVTGKGGSNVRVQMLRGKATQAEARAGTVDNRFLTPKGLRDATLLQSQTAASVAQIDFVLSTYTGYRNFIVEYDGVRPATDGSALWLRVSEDSGSTFKSGVSDYKYAVADHDFGTSFAGFGSTGAAQIVLSGNGGIDNGAAASGADGSVKFRNPAGATRNKKFVLENFAEDADGSMRQQQGAGAYIGTVNAINAIRFLMSAGNIADGTFRLYGIP